MHFLQNAVILSIYDELAALIVSRCITQISYCSILQEHLYISKVLTCTKPCFQEYYGHCAI